MTFAVIFGIVKIVAFVVFVLACAKVLVSAEEVLSGGDDD